MQRAGKDAGAPGVSREAAIIPQRADLEIGAPIVDISCTTGQGIEALKDAIKALVWSGEI